jgi:hypothetical protein
MRQQTLAYQAAAKPVLHRSEIALSGFSGARILLIRDGNSPAFVRKISADTAGNHRLHLQAIKQTLTRGLLEGVAATPNVIGEGELDGVYYFDMEYVQGLDGISFLRTASFREIDVFVSKMCESLELFSKLPHPSLRLKPRENAQQKCQEILKVLAPDDAQARGLIHELIEWTEKLDLPEDVAVTACHGDMTLENVVVTSKGELVFIDLLDSFFDHWLADVGKLDQDLRGGWYTRKSPALPIGIVRYVRGRLQRFTRGALGDLADMLPLLVCIHFARILPYAKGEADRHFVLERLSFLVGQLRSRDLPLEGSIK